MITRNAASRSLIVHSVRQFDALQVEHHRDQLRLLIDEGYQHLIMDLAETEYINSSGLGLFVEFFNTMRRTDGTFRLVNCRPEIMALLRQTRLDALLFHGETPADDPSVEQTPEFDQLHALMSREILWLTRINALVHALLQNDDPLCIGRLILDGLVDATGAARGALFFLTGQEEKLELAHWIDREHPDSHPRQTEYPLHFSRLEYEILNADSVVTRSIGTAPDQPAFHLFRSLGFDRLMAAPITAQMRRYGLICIDMPNPIDPESQVTPLIQTMTRLCGLALEKAALLRQVTQQNEELSEHVNRLQRSHRAINGASQLATLGTVVTGIGHQLNNKLVPMVGYLQLLMQQGGLPKDVLTKLSVVATATGDIQQCVGKLVQLSGMRTLQRKAIDPAERIAVAVDLLAGQAERRGVTIQTTGLRPIEVAIQGDPDLFLQAMVTLIHHSIGSFPADADGRDRWLNITSATREESYFLCFEDNAPLLETSIIDNIDPLESLDDIEAGRVFNLTIPRGILRRYKGAILLDSTPGGGKTITVALPLPLHRSLSE